MNNRKLNIKRVRDAIIWLSLIAGISALLFFSIQRKSNAQVKTLVVQIDGIHGDETLISEKEVEQIITKAAGKTIKKSNIKTLNLRKLEAAINKDKRIERADVYFDSKDRLNVKIIQKKPVIRVMQEAAADYYLDGNGSVVPVSIGNAIRVPIVTGITEAYDAKFLAEGKNSKLKEVFTIMKYVRDDQFLASLIEQAHVEQDSIGDIVLIPKIGKESVLFGDSQDMVEKFDKLKIFYRDGLPKLGWNRFNRLNLKISNQVIGTLANKNTPKIKMPSATDSLQAALVVDNKKHESIHH